MKTITPFQKMLSGCMIFIGMLIIFRVVYSDSLKYVSMLWNIFLAWIPFVLAGFLKDYRHREKWKQVLIFGTWLLFFPNALYIVTDLVHLQDDTNMPWYFDAVLLFASSVVGIVMAFVSLRKAELYLGTYYKPAIVSVLMGIVLFMGAFGVYLGRFERWNSWDVVSNPIALGLGIATKILNPLDNYRVWAITLLFCGIYAMLYYFIKTLPQALAGIKNTGQ